MHNAEEEQQFAEFTTAASMPSLNLESLDQVEAFYSLKIQEFRLLIEQLRKAKAGDAADSLTGFTDAIQPATDFAIRRHKAA